MGDIGCDLGVGLVEVFGVLSVDCDVDGLDGVVCVIVCCFLV